ncbi:MAG: winged helix-turn-helix domain-containing protein [Acidobacteriota bacterium]|nr:winged helix-turn-helix domain-containing protein [Acidobacteriota bacterium]
MNAPAVIFDVYRFGVFELDLRNHELRKRGVLLKLEAKPLQILEMLVGRPGEIVLRRQIQERLWPETFVMFDYSVNTAVNKLRSALGDSAENPRFIETIARRGYQFIASVEASRPFAAATGANGAFSSIAVLPFWNSGRQPEMEYLSDGLSEAVIRRLSQIPGLRVMAWSTVLRYKGRELDPQAAGQTLRVRAVLVGRVTPGDDGVSLSAELVDAETGWRLWGEDYRRGRDEIQLLPEEIAKGIAAKVRPQSTPEMQKALRKQGPYNPEAYSEYLKGRYHTHKLSRGALEKSVSHLQLAIEKDPDFALAYSALADAYVLLAFSALLPPREAMGKAGAAARRALELDDELAEAHASYAAVTKLYEWDWPKAEREYRICLELDPNNAIARQGYGGYLMALGRIEEALAEIRKAQELDPLSLVIGTEVAWNLYMARQFDKAVQQARRVLEMEPEFPATHHVLGLALDAQGLHEDAIACFQRASEQTGAQQNTIAGLAHACARCGRTKGAQAALKRLMVESRERYVAPYLFAVVYAGLGAVDETLTWAEKAFEEHDVWMIWIKQDPRFDEVRGTPRFRRLLQRLNFPE